MTQTKTAQVPREAMQFDSRFKFAGVAEDEPQRLYPIQMLGRSAKPIFHWWWGNVVHDMAGFSVDHDTVAIDFRHDDAEPIGFLDKFTADNDGLHLEGNLVALDPHDKEDRVVQLATLSKAGVPFQASIYFDAFNLEEVMPGASAEVNGYTIDGPAIIVRQWSLRGMAVCLYGADGRTHSKFVDDRSELNIPVSFTEPNPMTKKTLSNKQAKAAADKPLATKLKTNGKPNINKLGTKLKADDKKEAAEGDEEEEDAPASDEEEEGTSESDDEEEEAAPEGDDEEEEEGKAKKHSVSKERAELKRYVETFGHRNGADWFAAGIEFSEALEKHSKELSAALAAKDAEISTLNQKLKAVNRGETTPLKFSEDKEGKGSSKVPAQFANLGDGLARFAAGLKLPS